jgi:hypothetical protein
MSFQNGSPSHGKAAVLSLKKQHKDKITDDIQIKTNNEETTYPNVQNHLVVSALYCLG